MLVGVSAVTAELVFSSALAADAKLTTPTAASATVHLLNFIRSSDVSAHYVLFHIICIQRVKPVYPRTKTGAFP
jgi:hypothetical protein